MREDLEHCLDSELWHACAGAMVQMPPVNSRVFYFPQGHAEHTLTSVNFKDSPRIPSMILCKVDAVKYLADHDTDEVYAKIRLIPDLKNELVPDPDDDRVFVSGGSASRETHTSFAKTLTQSDANNGGGFSVPRYCAETIFPPLDFTSDPPVQNVIATDVHGETFQFRHIYRGTPRRHLLTTGWSSFVNQKKLIAGDSIVFWRADNGGLFVGIRRAKKSNPNPQRDREIVPGWSEVFRGFSSFLKEDPNISMNSMEKVRVKPDSVVEATYLAATGQPFEVEYYPRVNTPEFCVKASSVMAALRIQWFSGMRFKMPFETEDSSKISWFMGTVASVQINDSIRWPNSPWRMLQVTWDEPDLLQNVNCVSPWLVEMVSSLPAPSLSPPFLQPRKKMRGPLFCDIPVDTTQYRFTGRPLGPTPNTSMYVQETISAGIQGARHAQIGAPFSQTPRLLTSNFLTSSNSDGNENVSCLLSMGNSQMEEKTGDQLKTENQIMLFGKTIFIVQQKHDDENSLSSAPLLDTCHCKVFLDSEDVGKSIDLSGIESYEEMYARLEEMFELDTLDVKSNVFYFDSTGAVKRAGDVPFSEFAENAKRLTILTNPSNNKSSERNLISGLETGERGQPGALSIFA